MLDSFLSSRLCSSYQQDSNLVSHLRSIVFGKNENFNTLYSESAFVITFTSTRVEQLECPIMLRLSTASENPRSGIVLKNTVTSYHICFQ